MYVKARLTQKEVKSMFHHVVKVEYCRLAVFLKHKQPFAYTCGIYGWNSDIYDMGNGIAISTGYRTFGDMDESDYEKKTKVSFRSYEMCAKSIIEKSLPYAEEKQEFDKLTDSFSVGF